MQESTGEISETAETRSKVEEEDVTDPQRLKLLIDNTFTDVIVPSLTDANGRAELAGADNPRFDSQRQSNAKIAQAAIAETIKHVQALQALLRNPHNKVFVDKRYGDPSRDFISLENMRQDEKPTSESDRQPEAQTPAPLAEQIQLPANEAQQGFFLQNARREGGRVLGRAIIEDLKNDDPSKIPNKVSTWDLALKEDRINYEPNPAGGDRILKVIPPRQPGPQTPTKP